MSELSLVGRGKGVRPADRRSKERGRRFTFCYVSGVPPPPPGFILHRGGASWVRSVLRVNAGVEARQGAALARIRSDDDRVAFRSRVSLTAQR